MDKVSLAIQENLNKWFKEKWVRFGPDGKIRGACARGDDSEGKPKCLPMAKAHSLGKKGRAQAASRKRREDPNPERSGSAINVATRKEGIEMDNHQCPHCGGPLFEDLIMAEEKDACYYKVKSKYKIWPSAYASGALVQCRKKGASNWGNKTKSESTEMKKTYSKLKEELDMAYCAECLEDEYGTVEEVFEVTGTEEYEDWGESEDLAEAEYQGKQVSLHKPFRTSDGKGKFAVYAKNEKGNVVKVNFGDTTGLTIKTSNPERRRNFRARHNCDNPGPKHKARYWSCKAWSRGSVKAGIGA